MSQSTIHTTDPVAQASKDQGRWWDRQARRVLLRRLPNLKTGCLVLHDADQTHIFGDPADTLRAEIQAHQPRFFGALASGGSIAAGETYMAGLWSCDDLTALLRIVLKNPDVFNVLDGGWARIANFFHRIKHWFRRNHRAGSKQNIGAHYDLGNDFFQLFLDETMMYSCAVFNDPATPLLDASKAKIDVLCWKLRLTPNDHLLEIGSGWGSLALHAAKQFGCRVTTTTISERQYEHTKQRVADAGLSDRVTVLRKDYRDLEGSFDKLVSVEMIEAVGHEFLDTYFHCCGKLLKPDGLMLVQAITMNDQIYDAYRRSSDFIQRYVFPGGALPSVGAICGSVGRATDLRLSHLEDFAPHYALTLSHWRRRFFDNLPAVRSLGFDESFIRMWEYYLCYCEAGFLERHIGLAHLLFTQSR